MKQKLWKYNRLAILFLVVGVGTFIGFRQLQPPTPPSEANTHHQAYQRMLANVKALAVEPRIPGSKAIETARSRIVSQIKDMGLEPLVESATVTRAAIEANDLQRSRGLVKQEGQGVKLKAPDPGQDNKPCTENPQQHYCSDAVFDKNDEVVVKNIVVKIDAPNTDKGVLMMAQLDSVRHGPGAADDMVSVAALLEAMREQAKNKNLKNDLYFVFTDGEELGSMGAKAFIKAHPELKNSISHVVNLEARGSRGGLIMFETSDHNYDLVRYFASASSTPIAFSFTAELYKRMSSGTDLTDFLKAGYAGLNFAITEGIENYDQPSDTFDNLDRSSAYQYLLTALEMSDYAARNTFQEQTKQDGVYFSFWPGNLVLMGKLTAYGLAALAVVTALAWLGIQLRRQRVHIKQIVINSGWLLGVMAAAAVLSWGAVLVLTQALSLKDSSNTEALFLALAAVLTVAVLASFILQMRKQTLGQAIAGLLPVQLLLIIVSAVFLYSVSYLFIFPTLALLVVAALERKNIPRLVTSALFGVGILLLYVPVCWLLYAAFMLPASPVVMALGVMPLAMLAAFFATTTSQASKV